MNYKGSCHCGGIRFEVEGDLGIYPLAEAKDRCGKPTAAINVRCIEGLDLGSLEIRQFDGASP